MDPLATLDRPVAGRDYPADRDQFLAFPDEAACLRYLERLSCPTASSARPAVRPPALARLAAAARLPFLRPQTTVTAGTLFQGTRTPLRQWFAAAWLVATAEQGVSARQLAKPWTWAATRQPGRCCTGSGGDGPLGPAQAGRPGRDRHRGGPGRPDPAAGWFPATAAVAPEDRGEVPGRVRMQRLPSAAAGDLAEFLGRVVEPGRWSGPCAWRPGGRWPSSAS